MDHHYNVGARCESFPVTGLLISPITIVGVMDESLYPEFFRKQRCVVFTCIVDKNLDVDNVG